jgi:hypothetical protein
MGGLEAEERLISERLLHWPLAGEGCNSEDMKYSFDDVDINGGVYGSTGLRVRSEVDEGEDLSIANNVQPPRLYRLYG